MLGQVRPCKARLVQVSTGYVMLGHVLSVYFRKSHFKPG
jgi:hypothetical protein